MHATAAQGTSWAPGPEASSDLAHRYRPRPLVVEQLLPALDFLRRQGGRIVREVLPDSQPAWHGRALADLLEPTFEVGKFVDVLILSLPVHRPRIGDHVRNSVFVA